MYPYCRLTLSVCVCLCVCIHCKGTLKEEKFKVNVCMERID